MGLSVCFLVGALGPSGGVRAVVEHARALSRDHEMDVSLVVWSEDEAAGKHDLPLLTLERARARQFDVAVATWWRTAYALFSVPARRYAYFVQQLEERVYRQGDAERFGAALTHDLPVAFLSEAAWIVDLLGELRPHAARFHVPNGIDKKRFDVARRPAGERQGRLRVLVEGSPHLWYKGVHDAVEVLRRTSEPLETTFVSPEPPDVATRSSFQRVLGPLEHEAMPEVYAETDVLLKLSRVEGVFTPPLEVFHMGATCLVWPVTGHDEYIEHGRNGVVCDFDDMAGTAHWLELLASRPALLDELRRGALHTASRWPSLAEASRRFAAALMEIAAGPAPDAGAASAQLLADASAGMADQRMAQLRGERRAAALERRLAHLEHAAARLDALERTRTFRARERAWRLLVSIRR